MNASPVRWWEVEVRVAVAVAEDVAALVVAAGADGAEIDEHGDSATLRLSFAGEHPEAEVVRLTRAALAELGVTAELTVRERADTDWSERWKEYFEPLNLGRRVWIVPSWHEEGFSPPEGALAIEVDPGMAFGTGQHATTGLCIEWLERHVAAAGVTGSVLDVGCGSGILSMVGHRLGANRVVGIDNDPVAVEVARDNAEVNGIDELELSETPLAEVAGTFDIVVANILSHILCELAPELVRHTAPGGWLVLSGIFDGDGQEQAIMEAFTAVCSAAGRAFAPEREVRKNWLLLAARL